MEVIIYIENVNNAKTNVFLRRTEWCGMLYTVVTKSRNSSEVYESEGFKLC